MTKEEYESRLAQWSEAAKREMTAILHAKTHGQGELEKINVSVKEDTNTTSHHAAYKFARYGVFVAYGVGRGWVRRGGQVVRGSRVEKGSALWHQMKKRGYQNKEMKTYSASKGGKSRKPLDWFDAVLTRRIGDLGDIAAEYYGDMAMENMLDILNRSTIKKNYTTSDL